MDKDRQILKVITNAMALVRAEDALDAQWSPERAAVAEDRTAALVREVRALTGRRGWDGNGRIMNTALVLVRAVLHAADDAIIRSACEEIAELID